MRVKATKDEKMETIASVLNDVRNERNISLHDVWYILEYALEYVDCKKDLTDSEILSIKNIRESIKGL